MTLALLIAIGFLAQVAPVSAANLDRMLVLLPPDSTVAETTQAIEAAGGHVTHIFPPSALIAQVPTGTELPAETRLIHTPVADEAAATTSPAARRAIQVWNRLLSPPTPTADQDRSNLAADLVGDALTPPASHTPPALKAASTPEDGSPDYAETSEFLIGRVAVGIILPESDGRTDTSTEDWTEEERATVLSEIGAALDWWAALEPNAHLTFIYDDGTAAPIPTGYEPISRAYSDEALWIGEVMAAQGYTQTSYFDQVRSYNNDLRDIHDTDWAFTIFVVDSSHDDDQRFADGSFAYAYLGGPFLVMTYGNSGYGPQNMDAIAAHEIGHIFLALDQYQAAHQSCTRQSGYLGVENLNSQYGDCPSNEPSIMRGQVAPYTGGDIDPYARGQIGWRDSDGDGILDPLDTTLSIVSSGYVTDVAQSNVLTFTGSVRDDPFSSPIRRSVTINIITHIQYRVTDGEWTAAQPTDGAFDEPQEEFTFTPPPLPTGEHEVEVRVLDSAGNEMTQTIATVSAVDPVDQILDTQMSRMLPQIAGEEPALITYHGQGISSVSHIAAMYYRIDEQPWQALPSNDGEWDESQESFSLTIDPATLGAGQHHIQAYSMDAEGNVETSPASDLIVVAPSVQYIFLPLVTAAP